MCFISPIPGDRRTPVGMYPLGVKFGFQARAEENYVQVTENTICVDGKSDQNYNTILNSEDPRADGYLSWEQMIKYDVYDKGFEVLYNQSRVLGAGSCIFLHLWESSDRGTAGCIAMSREYMNDLHKWIGAEDKVEVIISAEPVGEFPVRCE